MTFINGLWRDNHAGLISILIIINIADGFLSGKQSGKNHGQFKKIANPISTIIRDNKIIKVESKEIVPGDVIILNQGDKFQADGKLISGSNVSNRINAHGKMKRLLKLLRTTKILYLWVRQLSPAAANGEKIGSETSIGKIGRSLSEIKKIKPLFKKLASFTPPLPDLLFSQFNYFYNRFIGRKNIWEMIRFSANFGCLSQFLKPYRLA